MNVLDVCSDSIKIYGDGRVLQPNQNGSLIPHIQEGICISRNWLSSAIEMRKSWFGSDVLQFPPALDMFRQLLMPGSLNEYLINGGI